MKEFSKLVQYIVKGIQEKKGQETTVVDLTKIESAPSRYFVVCQGNSPAQIEAIARSVADTARIEMGEKPAYVDGLQNSMWVAMDYGDVMVHIFLPETREFYDIENLWQDASLTHIPNID